MASVSVRQLRKSFGDMPVIRGVDLDVADGEFVVLVGPSGCGKSTLLRLIAGLEEATGGAILIGDADVTQLAPKARDVAMVFQSYALYPLKTVFNNMAFGLRVRRQDPATIRNRVSPVADALGLNDYLQRFPKELSGGQRQRVAMGRAIVRAPKVFLFDEPLSNLDARLRVQMRLEIKARHMQLKTTTVYVTHDQIEAMTMADRIVVMHDGIIEQVGTPRGLYERPENTFVATFIGSPAMNLLEAVIRRDDGRAWAETDDGTRLPLPADADGEDGRSIFYGLRPEHMDVGTAGDGFDGAVELVELTGAQIQVFCRVGRHQICTVFDNRFSVKAGDKLRLTPQAGAVHVFDRETGRRL